ncbi:hypothetical protein ACO22_00654 [Paracoccidioides brasiliensis]|uniref:Uncharacterized protein n=1 Tax=Paracoccidioides brasiliensis TaxID=121759 RepID=A0A1D2JP26_PARBR|nr:hypothetical protein ACO22_00654 [Paracoccidioides brasiliensis]
MAYVINNAEGFSGRDLKPTFELETVTDLRAETHVATQFKLCRFPSNPTSPVRSLTSRRLILIPSWMQEWPWRLQAAKHRKEGRRSRES